MHAQDRGVTASQWWTGAALALGAIATLLFVADHLAVIREAERYIRREKAEPPVHMPLRVDLHQRFNLGEEPTDPDERQRLLEERVGQIGLRVDREVGEVREYGRANIERLVQAEREQRRRAIEATDSVLRAITLDGRWQRTLGYLCLTLAVGCNVCALLATP